MSQKSIHVGLLVVTLSIPHAQSLKARRSALRAIKDRLKAINVAFAEVGDCEHWQTATLAITAVAGDGVGIDRLLNQASDIANRSPDAVVTGEERYAL